ncbi:SDR family oxidoreductase [Saccharothrix deserti]|uniref:SDR family oxidoreductase n=1 Tax=Saccharothrix deserti TaxID=2593674 RepID=UPI00131B83AD|nr:SDR family oxidoreductase [Saccharothrix deserti]
MSTYFVTGATGFTGRRPLGRLLRRPACERVFALVRPRSADELGRHDELTPVLGDVTSTEDDRDRHPPSPHRTTEHAAVNTLRATR